MVFADWTHTGIGGSSSQLDTSIKQSGNSSAKINISQFAGDWGLLTHNTFLESQATVIFYCRIDQTLVTVALKSTSYGQLSCKPSVIDAFQKFKCTFWYDIVNNTKWGRVEKWVDSAWVQQGSDTNFGSGSPSSGEIGFYLLNIDTEIYGRNAWFDEVEVYS